MGSVLEEEFDVSDISRQVNHYEKSTSVSPNYIIHFTRKFQTLKLIIKNGFRPSESEEYPIFLQAYYEIEGLLQLVEAEEKNIENRKVPLVCFCDHINKNLRQHKKRYGYYGIGLSKTWAISNFISPIFYIAKDTSTHSIMYSIMNLTKRIIELKIHEEDPEITQLIQELYQLLDFIKPYQEQKSGLKYYDEREWRYVPNRYFDINDPNTYLKFKNQDVVVIYVKTAKEKREIHQLLERSGGRFKKSKIRLSRKK